jgi:hypothetical protein
VTTLVPPELLVPPDVRSRDVDNSDTALVLDHWLRRLAAQKARGRTVLGRLAAALLRLGVQPLGFARLDDYARERLGMSGRELQSLASVVTRLGRLPRIQAAFRDGALSWAQVRLLVRVATAETEAEWLQRARGRTTRALEAFVRPAARGAEADDDAEPAMHFRLRCARRVRRLWSETVELARCVAGARLTQAHAAEAIAAEGLSAARATADAWPSLDAPPPPPPDSDEVPASHVDWTAVREALPVDVEALAERLVGLDQFALDERLCAAVHALQQIDWQSGRLLRIFFDRRLHRAFGFRSAARYVRERLGISARKARALVAVERKTWEAPAFGDAYRAGTLSAVRALTLLPVVRETTAAAWVTRAREVTVRRLADEVEWALVTGEPAPPAPDASLALTERQMRARPDWELEDAEIAFSAPTSVVALFRTAILSFAGPAGSFARGLENLLHHARDTWRGLPAHRDPVFARDGWRCAVPACSARRELHDHHVVFRSQGGGNGRDNRIAICAAHHLRGIHAGYVRAAGNVPDGLVWELGVRAGKPPLARLVGDAYAA